MEAETPEWMTTEFLEEVLNEEPERTRHVVDSFEVKSAIPKGNNYVCDVIRVKINYRTTETDERKVKSLIMKVPKEGGLSDMLMDMGIIQREMEIYESVIGRLSRIYGENIFTPKAYKSSRKNVLILEDLNTIGFKMADRRKQLTYEECTVALKALARFHAASVKCHEEEPEFIEGFGEKLFTEKLRADFGDMIGGFFVIAADEISKLPDCSAYNEKLLGCKDKAFDTILDIIAVRKDNFNVLNHGDFWVTNMLFLYDDEGNPTNVKLIDLQVSRYNSPACDLTYFFSGSVQEDVRSSRSDDLLSVYLDELNSALEKVGTDRRLEREQLEAEMERFNFFGLYVCINLLPIVLCDPEGTFEMKELTEDDMKNFTESDQLRKNFRTQLYKKVIPHRMADFDAKGLF